MNIWKGLKIALCVGIVSLNGITVDVYAAPKLDTYKVYAEQRIALDAGHYYKETYKSSPDGYLEVLYNLDMVKAVKKYIEQDRPHVKVIETNPDGVNTLRAGRGKIAKDNKAQILISLHMDSLGGGWQNRTYGTHIIVDTGSSAYTRNIAKNIINSYSRKANIPLARKGGLDIRGHGKDEISMLRVGTELGVPSMLIEMSFMDHSVYGRKFRDDSYKQFIARQIADAIIEEYIDVHLRVIGTLPKPEDVKENTAETQESTLVAEDSVLNNSENNLDENTESTPVKDGEAEESENNKLDRLDVLPNDTDKGQSEEEEEELDTEGNKKVIARNILMSKMKRA